MHDSAWGVPIPAAAPVAPVRLPRVYLNTRLVHAWQQLYETRGALPSPGPYRDAVLALAGAVEAVDAMMPTPIEETHV